MDLSRVPERGVIQVSGGFVNFFRKDDVIYVPLDDQIIIPVLSEDGAIIAKEFRFKAVGSTKCDPNDKFSLRYGVRKAYARALERLQVHVCRAERKNAARSASEEIARDLKQVRSELKAMDAKFARAKEKALAK